MSGGDIFVPVTGAPIPEVAEIGGKGRALTHLAELAADGGYEVPAFLVLSSRLFLELAGAHGVNRRDPSAAQRRQEEILCLSLPDALRGELAGRLADAGLERGLVAVRSSASDEDGNRRSFAGQFDSVLGVPFENNRLELLWDAVRRVWASAFSPHALAYLAAEERPGGVRMAVVVEMMVDPSASGVAFSCDPVSGDSDTAVVSAVYGLGEGLVSGELDADTYRVRFEEEQGRITSRDVPDKPVAIRLSPGGGTGKAPVKTSLRGAPVLSEEEVLKIAGCSRFLASHFGGPQDVEWALVGDGEARRLVVLQTRPITARGDETGPVSGPTQGERIIWDNSNIIESYSGVTTPLTFSFASGVYEDVYLQFCRLMGVSEKMIEARRPMFANMLGLIRGRIYYQLLNWYRMLALLPGFRFNRGFMERMMGVRESLDDAIEPPGAGGRLADLARLVRMAYRILREERRIDRKVVSFQNHVDAVLAPVADDDLTSWPASEILVLYHRLENELLHRWQPPIVNDFLAMIWFGVLGRLTERWLPGFPPTLVNDLLCGEGGIISTEPARRVMKMAQRVAGSPELTALFDRFEDNGTLWEELSGSQDHAPFFAMIDDYIRRFGDRSMEELKLETITLSENPVPLLGLIRAYLVSGAMDPVAARERETRVRQEAETRVRAELTRLRWWIYRTVLQRARRRVRDRENLRFDRTRVFGVVRRMYLALGERLASGARVESPRDVFYLTRDEVFACFEESAFKQDLRQLVGSRREEFEEYQRTPAPPDRFETIGSSLAPVPTTAAVPGDADELRGIGCCPGEVRARACVVRHPHEASGLPGNILVAERTDPGWTLLFPMAAGILVERGSLLSHSAIVAREMGIPCVVGIHGLLAVIRDGETLEMNGTTGTVRRSDGDR